MSKADQQQSWYEAAFQADYLDRYPHRDETEARRAADLVVRHASPAPGAWLLDLCCGAGRHAVEFARRGFRTVGFDLSQDLLREARRRASAPGVALARGDMRALAFADHSFDVVTHFFTAFGYFDADEENLAVFAEVARVLRPGGTYLFDFLNADQVRAAVEEQPDGEQVEERGNVVYRSRRRISPDGRRIEKDIVVFVDGRPGREVTESVRLFSPAELEAGLAARGLRPVSVWGDYGGGPFGPESPRWICMARRRDIAP